MLFIGVIANNIQQKPNEQPNVSLSPIFTAETVNGNQELYHLPPGFATVELTWITLSRILVQPFGLKAFFSLFFNES